MKFNFINYLVFIALTSLSGCETVATVAQGIANSARGTNNASPSTTTAVQASAKTEVSIENAPPCSKNFQVSGSFMTGRQYKSSVQLLGISAETAYKKAFSELAKKGWQIIASDRDARMISANQGVSLSRSGRTVPMTVIITDEPPRSSNVSLTVSLSGGMMTSEDAIRNEFCDFAQALSTK